MIKKIKELNFPTYITLQTADISMTDMAERTITSQVKIDGNIKPSFVGTDGNPLAVMFDGEKYVLKNLVPQASKDNETMPSVIDLTFYHWAELELQRYFFIDMATTDSGTAKSDNYIASLSLKFTDFVTALNNVLTYYFGGRIVAVVFDGAEFAEDATYVEISYTNIWELLKKVYDTYGVRWEMVTEDGVCKIKFGYPSQDIDHVFEYGFNGGLLKVERQVQDDDIKNVLLGRGGDKNLPARYFKNTDPQNPSFNADPDWIPELKDMYFDGLRDAAFRSYVQGWKAKHYGGTVTEFNAYVQWAYKKGYNDSKFDPVEYVADDIVSNPSDEDRQVSVTPSYSPFVKKGSSIDKYGPLWDGLDKNDEIYPTLQGMVLDGIGRADEAVDVEQIGEGKDEVEEKEPYLLGDIATRNPMFVKGKKEATLYSSFLPTIVIPEGYVANVTNNGYTMYVSDYGSFDLSDDSLNKYIVVKDNVRVLAQSAYNDGDKTWKSAHGLEAGAYKIKVELDIENTSDQELNIMADIKDVTVNYSAPSDSVLNTFNVWIKNIFQTEKGQSETEDEYIERVWKPVLGDKEETEAALSFTSGRLAHENYEFKFAKNPKYAIHYDTSKSLNGVPSHWRLTLVRSDVEKDTLGTLIPYSMMNGAAGDFFVLAGIDVPYLYYTEAEKRLTLYKTEYLDKVKDIKPTWVVSLVKTRISEKQNEETEALIGKLKAGAVFKLDDKRFIEGEPEELYISSITYSYKEPTNNDPYIVPDIELVLSDKPQIDTYSTSTIAGEIESVKTSLQGVMANFNSLRERFIRKDSDDSTNHTLTMKNAKIKDELEVDGSAKIGYADVGELLEVRGFSKFDEEATMIGGAQFGPAFSDGITGFGGKIDGYGNGWLDSLRIRRFLEVPELRYNRVSIQIGNEWRAPGGGIIKEVTPDYDTNGNLLMTGTITLHLEDGEIGTIVVDDICQGIYHDEVRPSNNEVSNNDDGRGNFKFAGFFTCYFRVTEIVETAKNSKFRYALRAVSDRWAQTHHPCESMHFVSYGNFTEKERQSSRYSTLTYERFLKDVNDWEFGENNIAAQFGDLSNLSIFGLNMDGYSAYLNNIYMSGVIKQFEMLPLRMEIDTQGDQFLAYGESLTVTCHVKKGWDDLTSEVVRWHVVRDSGDPADDAAWKLRDKVKNFDGTIEMCHDEDATIDDLGNTNTLSTLFTFTAYLQDGNDTSFTLAI